MFNNVLVVVLNISLLIMQTIAFVHNHRNSDKASKALDMSIIVLAFGIRIIPLLIEHINVF